MKRQNKRYFTGTEKAIFLRFLEKRRDARRAEMLYKLMFATGLRIRETLNLNIEDVQGKDLISIIGKGDKLREIPLSKAIQTKIDQFLSWKKRKGESLAPNAPLFYSRKHGRLTNRAIQFDLDRLVFHQTHRKWHVNSNGFFLVLVKVPSQYPFLIHLHFELYL